MNVSSKCHTTQVLAVTALSLMSVITHAADVTITRLQMIYDVNSDGTYTMEKFEDVKINEPSGITSRAQSTLSFSESMESLEVIDAYTITKDGQRIDVPTDKILTQQSPISANAPMFSDHKVKAITFPQVEIGSTVSLHYKFALLKPYLPGAFSMHNEFSKFGDFASTEVILRAPAKMTLYMDSSGLQGGEVKSSNAATREWHWVLQQTIPVPYEPGTISMDDISPYVHVSNAKSYDDIANAYAIGSKAASRVTPVIQKQADAITQGISDKRAQTEAIYRWVASNIRYVAIYMNAGGYIPHDAEAVLLGRYGDCKDHTVLLEALLAAKGIKSSPALINAGNSYVLPKVAGLNHFNHVITYLPDYKLFVDSTANFATFGILSDALAGKTTLIINAEKNKPALRAIPVTDTKNTTIAVHTNATISSDGSITGHNSTSLTGVYDMVYRASFGSLPKDRYAQIASGWLSMFGQTGSAELQIGDGRDLAIPFQFEDTFTVPHGVQLPGPGAFNGQAGIGSFFNMLAYTRSFNAPERKLPFQCVGSLREELTQLALPDNMKITVSPKDATITSKFGTYQSTFTQEGSQLTIKRTLELNFPNPSCSTADYAEMKAMMDTIALDLNKQILYQ